VQTPEQIAAELLAEEEKRKAAEEAKKEAKVGGCE
jgi:hypothetical protein